MLGVLAIFIAMSGMPHEAVVAGPGGSFGLSASGDPDPGGAKLVVNVAGAVVNPGIYRLPVGSRVGDAVLAAGGYGPRVDVARVGTDLNLAAPLTDGVQVRVPSRDDPQAVGGGPGSGTSAGSGGQGAAPGGIINVNTASQSELES